MAAFILVCKREGQKHGRTQVEAGALAFPWKIKNLREQIKNIEKDEEKLTSTFLNSSLSVSPIYMRQIGFRSAISSDFLATHGARRFFSLKNLSPREISSADAHG